MSKKIWLILSVLIIIGIGGAWYYYSNSTKEESQNKENDTAQTESQFNSLQEVIEKSVVVAEIQAEDDGKFRTTGEGKVFKDYAVTAISQQYPLQPLNLKRFYLSIPGETGQNGSNQLISGAPELKKEGVYLVFATIDKDGYLHPSANGLAVAAITRSADKYVLPESVLPTSVRVFDIDTLRKAATVVDENRGFKTEVR